MLTPELIEAYWAIVEESAQILSAQNQDYARKKVREYRKTLRESQYELNTYHAEPFAVAWELLHGKPLNDIKIFGKYKDAYENLIKRHYGSGDNR